MSSTAIPNDVEQKLKHQFLVVRQQAIDNLVSPLKGINYILIKNGKKQE